MEALEHPDRDKAQWNLGQMTLSGCCPLMSRWHMTAAVQIADIVAITTCIPLNLFVFHTDHGLISTSLWIAEALITGVALYLVFYMFGSYSYKLLGKPGLSSMTVVAAWIVVSGPIILLNMAAAVAGAVPERSMVAWSVAVICLVTVIRLLAAQAQKALVSTGLLAHTICVIGDGIEAQSCVIQAQRDTTNVVLLGYFLANSRSDGNAMNTTYLGHVEQLPIFLHRQRVDEIIVATTLGDTNQLNDLIADLRCLPVSLSIWPESLNLPAQWITTTGSSLGDTPLLPVGRAPLGGWTWVIKDVQDRTVAALLLLACLPALILIAIAIRVCSPGPVLFRQVREGYCGREFRIYKFRSMHVASPNRAGKLVLATRTDSRTYPMGAFLRRTSLDELPQLFNVLCGDMWLVGPRPHSPLATAADRLYVDAVKRYASRHTIKPGMTGWAQINGWRGPTSTIEQIEQRVAHDLHYIRNWSPLFDLRILLLTAVRGFVHRNAF